MSRFTKLIYLIIGVIIGSLSVGIWLDVQVYAQTGRIDDFTFFIPFASENMLAHLKIGNNLVNQAPDVSLQTTISIPVNRSGTIIYYDHWEDGYEAALTLPTQDSTQVWGDGVTTNGVAPTVRNQGDGDTLLADDVIILENRVFLPDGARDPNVIYYDGGDVLTALGGSIAVTEVVWPLIGDTDLPSSLYTDAWELYPTNRWGRQYQVPVGEDLVGLRRGFTIVGLSVQAVKTGTMVTITDKNGTVKDSATLGYGEELSILTGITVGDHIQASAPVQVQLFTADPRRDYEERGNTLVPVEQWRTDYLAPRSSGGDFWLYNPQTSTLTITVNMSTGSNTVAVPPGQTVRYSNNGSNLSTATGAHFSAAAPFYGTVALDEREIRDWGYSLQPIENLTPQTLIGWAPGNNQTPPTDQGNYSPVYVTALTSTTVTVHFADDAPDIEVFVPALAEVAITSPNEDMTGAYLFTTDGTSFLAVWGEEETALPGQPVIDAGSNIVPLSSLALQKSFHPRDSLDCTGAIRTDDRVRFTLQYFNNAAFGGTVDVTLQDDLPPALIYTPGSTQLNGVSVPDGPGGIAPFSSAAGGLNALSTQGGSGRLTFDAVVADDSTPITNQANADAPLLGAARAEVTIPFDQPVRPILQIEKKLVDPAAGPVTWGQILTFRMVVTNTSRRVAIDRLILQDIFDADVLTFLQASRPPDIVATGSLTWTNLITDGAFLPNERLEVRTSFEVKSVPSTMTGIVNEAAFNDVHTDDGVTRIVCNAETEIDIVAPPPTPTLPPTVTPPPTSPPSSSDDETPPPTPTPNVTPPPTVSPTINPSLTPSPAVTGTLTPAPVITTTGTPLPVNLLPETGTTEETSVVWWLLAIILALGTIIGIIVVQK